MAELLEHQPGYILHRRPFKESSLILDVFTLNFGRLSLVAKGAAKVTKKSRNQAALLQPFQPLLLNWSGRSNMKTLCGFEASTDAFKLSGTRLYCGYYLNELLVSLTPEYDSVPSLFAAYAQAIESLASLDLNVEPVLRLFEFHVMNERGQTPSFEYDVSGDAIQDVGDYSFHVEEGFRRVHVNDRELNEGRQRLYQGKQISLLDAWFSKQACVLDEDSLRCCKILMRQLVDNALQGRKLKSREMFRQLKTSLSQ